MSALVRPRISAFNTALLIAALAGSALLVTSLPAAAGNGQAAQAADAKDKQEQEKQRQHEQRSAPAPRAAPGPRAAPAGAPPGRPPQAGNTYRRDDGRGDVARRPDYRAGSGSTIAGPPRGPQRPDAGGSWQSRPGYRPPPPRQVVSRLPSGYRSYNWRGTPYYHYGRAWYRPYGSSFLLVGAPFGLFVPFLPSYYSTLWIGGNRYYYADDTYYMYEPERRGYVVTRSPYDDASDEVAEGDDDQARTDEDLYIYPTRGQSEQQQADDRYECHRWAADQTHYDPTDADYNRDDREQYDRALTACLTGRGYSVK